MFIKYCWWTLMTWTQVLSIHQIAMNSSDGKFGHFYTMMEYLMVKVGALDVHFQLSTVSYRLTSLTNMYFYKIFVRRLQQRSQANSLRISMCRAVSDLGSCHLFTSEIWVGDLCRHNAAIWQSAISAYKHRRWFLRIHQPETRWAQTVQ